MRYWSVGWASLIFACSPCYNSEEPNYTNYPVRTTSHSALGFGIDDPNNELDLTRLDKIVGSVRDCIASLRELTDNEIAQGDCITPTPIAEVRSCLTVKTAPDWHLDCLGKEQVFGNAPVASCEAKGETPTASCPCEFRAIIQDNCTIVTAPNMKILAGQLATLMTTCNDSWVGRIYQCAEISVEQ
jgi:hypothetical protein